MFKKDSINEGLTAYIPEDRRYALSMGIPLPERSTGAALFADISGFTPLAESLAEELGPQRGAEELVIQLNNVYGALIGEIQRFRGSVIGFSGDAITCWLDGDNGLRAAASALAMQEKMRQGGTITTPGGSVISLSIKVAIASGPIRRLLPGNPQIQDVLAGRTLEKMAAAEHQAQKGEIVVTEAVAQALDGQVVIVEWREEGGERYAVLTGLLVPVVDDPWPDFHIDSLSDAEVHSWLLPAVYEWLSRGQSEFLAELRPAVSLFLKFTGIDYDDDPAAGEKLDAFICWAQSVLAHYEGSIIQLTIGDKGSYLYAAFGAPVAHADDSVRAVGAAWVLRHPPSHLDYIQGIQIGVARGRMFAGAYGSESRRTYGVIGDKTNLAARLMGVAQPGQIRCDYEVYNTARSRWSFETLSSVRVKGKAGLVRVYEPAGEIAQDWEGSQLTLIGRRAELSHLEADLVAVETGLCRVVLLEGEAGIGKTRLVAELLRLAREHGISGLVGAGQSIEQQTPYRAWRDLVTAYFGLGKIVDQEERKARITNLVSDVAPDELPRLPLLNDILSVGLPDTELTATLDPAQRQQSLVILLVHLLRTWTAERPLLLILEDAQWLDSLSWELTTQVARALVATGEPFILVVVTRELEAFTVGAQQLAALRTLEASETISLDSMNPDDILSLLSARLGVAPDGLPRQVGDFVNQRCGGNPFFAEELLFALREQGLLTVEPGTPYNQCVVQGNFTRASQTLPDTLHGLLLARIDHLPADHKLTLKVAAVIGRTFAYPPLQYILSSYATIVEQSLQEQLSTLIERDFTALESREPDLSYIFKHVITQETAYQTLLFSQRRQIHRVAARWYETRFGADTLAPYYPLLAHHYHQAEDVERERRYARLAGEQAAAQFANAEAVRYLSRTLELTPESDVAERYEILLNREKVYDLQGQREMQRQDLEALQALAKQLHDEARQSRIAGRFARYAIAIGDYPLTIIFAQQAIGLAQSCRALDAEASGTFFWGRALWHQGQYDQARTRLNRAIELAQAANVRDVEADSLLALGLVAWHQSDFEGAKRVFEQALTIFHEIGSRGGEAMAYNNLGIISAITGDLAAATSYFGQCLRISQEMGGRRSEAMASTNLGNIAAMLLDYPQAKRYFEQVVTISREIGDRQVEASSLGNLGVISDRQGDYSGAEPYFRQALAIYQAIGDRHNEAMVLSNLSLFSHHLGDQPAALTYSQQALEIAESLNDTHLQGETLTYRGHALAGLSQLAEASNSYERALTLRRELGEQPLVMESLAGLARVCLAQNDIAHALVHVEEILSYLDQGSLDGAEEPLHVYLTCYTVLNSSGDPRAQSVLETAYRLLSEQIEMAGSDRFVENVAVHREIMESYKGSV